MIGTYLSIKGCVFEPDDKFSENNGCLVEYASFLCCFITWFLWRYDCLCLKFLLNERLTFIAFPEAVFQYPVFPWKTSLLTN